MEIPTKEIIERLESQLTGGNTGSIALDAIDTINAQSREILELQATICRLKSEYLEKQVNYEAVISRTRDEAVRIVAEQRLARQVDDEARRIRDLGDD